MPTWGELLQELGQIAQAQVMAQQAGGPPPTAGPADLLRRKYLDLLHQHTARAVIYYGTAWHETRPITGIIPEVTMGEDVR